LPLTQYEALQRIAHRVAIDENERKDLEAAFLNGFGSAEEKKRFYTESDADKEAREAEEKFNAAVEAEVKKRRAAADDEKAVKAAADKAEKASKKKES
jgi:hypothetical protein